MPPRWKGSAPPGARSASAIPARDQKAATSYAPAIRVGTLQAVARDDGVDEAGVAFVDLVGAEPDPLEGGRAQVGQEDVGLRHQLMRQVQAAFGREVEGDGALAPVIQLEHRIGRQVTTEDVEEGPTRVSLGRLDLDHVRTPVGQDAGGPGTGDPDPEFDHLHALQGSTHGAATRITRRGMDCRALTNPGPYCNAVASASPTRASEPRRAGVRPPCRGRRI